MKIHELQPNEGSTKNRKRVGHGISAGQGKTAGKGTKGQNSRAGEGGRLYRQGGNLPFYRRLPFIRGEGFTPPNQIEFNEINLATLERFAANTEITPALLASEGLLHNPANPVVVLGRGELKTPLIVHVHRVSKGARAKIEAAGGKVELVTEL